MFQRGGSGPVSRRRFAAAARVASCAGAPGGSGHEVRGAVGQHLAHMHLGRRSAGHRGKVLLDPVERALVGGPGILGCVEQADGAPALVEADDVVAPEPGLFLQDRPEAGLGERAGLWTSFIVGNRRITACMALSLMSGRREESAPAPPMLARKRPVGYEPGRSEGEPLLQADRQMPSRWPLSEAACALSGLGSTIP
jgi:hypothetical protein